MTALCCTMQRISRPASRPVPSRSRSRRPQHCAARRRRAATQKSEAGTESASTDSPGQPQEMTDGNGLDLAVLIRSGPESFATDKTVPIIIASGHTNIDRKAEYLGLQARVRVK